MSESYTFWTTCDPSTTTHFPHFKRWNKKLSRCEKQTLCKSTTDQPTTIHLVKVTYKTIQFLFNFWQKQKNQNRKLKIKILGLGQWTAKSSFNGWHGSVLLPNPTAKSSNLSILPTATTAAAAAVSTHSGDTTATRCSTTAAASSSSSSSVHSTTTTGVWFLRSFSACFNQWCSHSFHRWSSWRC